jgi:hypothetical protein
MVLTTESTHALAGRQTPTTSVLLQRTLDELHFGANNQYTFINQIFVSLFNFSSPLMTKERGWGSRPILGKDWGISISCESTALNKLIMRFERSIAMNGTFCTLL